MFTPFCSADLGTLSTAQKRDLIVQLRESIKNDAVLKRDAKASDKAAKAALRADKRAERILKLEAKLEALKNPAIQPDRRKRHRWCVGF